MNQETFQNPPLCVAELPQLAILEWQALAQNYRSLTLLVDSIAILILTALWLVIWLQPFWSLPQTLSHVVLWGGLAITSGAIVNLVYDYYAIPLQAYALRQHDLSFRSGIFFRKSVTQPILRIQHIELKQGPLERKAGLATLQVFSAGGATQTFEIPGVTLATAESIRQLILEHKAGLRHD